LRQIFIIKTIIQNLYLKLKFFKVSSFSSQMKKYAVINTYSLYEKCNRKNKDYITFFMIP
jgi:hypothetical protein